MITVDCLSVVQLISLLIENQDIREVSDAMAKRIVLILGNFSAERAAELDTIRALLRKRHYAPLKLDARLPGGTESLAAVSALAAIACAVVVDCNDPAQVTHEVTLLANTAAIPIHPLLFAGMEEPGDFAALRRRCAHIAAPYCYIDAQEIQQTFEYEVLEKMETRLREIAENRRAI